MPAGHHFAGGDAASAAEAALPWLQDIILSPGENAAIRRWAGELDDDPYARNSADYDERLRSRLSALPCRLVEGIAGFGRAGCSAGVLRVRGIPVPEALPPTPCVSYSTINRRIGTEPVMLAVAMLAGAAISLPQMRDGQRVHNIYPLPEDAETQKASNAIRLELHTEMAFQAAPPDALAILCLRAGDTPPATGFCDMRPAWESLSSADRVLLQEPAFAFRYTGPDPQRKFFDPQPVATDNTGGLRIQFDSAAHGVTPTHAAALATLRDRAAQSVTELTLASGDFTLIDNRCMVHGRSPMAPNYRGNERWLQRCLLRIMDPPDRLHRTTPAE